MCKHLQPQQQQLKNFQITKKQLEIDRFLRTYNLPRLNQEEIKNPNRPITSNEVESVIKKLQTKVQDQMTSHTNSKKHLKKR